MNGPLYSSIYISAFPLQTYLYLANVVLSYMAATVLTLTIESPMMTIEKLVFARVSKKSDNKVKVVPKTDCIPDKADQLGLNVHAMDMNTATFKDGNINHGYAGTNDGKVTEVHQDSQINIGHTETLGDGHDTESRKASISMVM